MNKDYWTNSYKEGGPTLEPSNWACLFTQLVDIKDKHIVDLGCGNCRDSLYFIQQEPKLVTAIDQCEEGMKYPRTIRMRPVVGDFVDYSYEDFEIPVDIFYSRFSLHAIEGHQMPYLMRNVFDNLCGGGIFAIEARTTLDPLFGQGQCIDQYTWKTDYKRRFIDSQIFLKDVISWGYKVKYFNERDGLTPYGEDDPVVMRIILEK